MPSSVIIGVPGPPGAFCPPGLHTAQPTKLRAQLCRYRFTHIHTRPAPKHYARPAPSTVRCSHHTRSSHTEPCPRLITSCSTPVYLASKWQTCGRSQRRTRQAAEGQGRWRQYRRSSTVCPYRAFARLPLSTLCCHARAWDRTWRGTVQTRGDQGAPTSSAPTHRLAVLLDGHPAVECTAWACGADELRATACECGHARLSSPPDSRNTFARGPTRM